REPLVTGVQTCALPISPLAFAFDVPRICVIIDTPTSPAASRPSQTGTRIGGLAPTASASNGSHTDTGSGSSSATLYTPGAPCSRSEERRVGKEGRAQRQ